MRIGRGQPGEIEIVPRISLYVLPLFCTNRYHCGNAIGPISMKTDTRKKENKWCVLWDKIWAPSEMFLDPYLSHLDTRIGGIFAACQKQGIVVIGQRRVAKMCRASLRDVNASLKRLVKRGYVSCSLQSVWSSDVCSSDLVKRGYVSCSLQSVGMRNTYCLTNPMYAQLIEDEPVICKDDLHGRSWRCDVCKLPVDSVVCEGCQRRQELADAI